MRLSRKGQQMPRERVQHGKLYADITETPDPGNVGQTPGSVMRRVEYRPDVALPEGATVREEPSLDVSWNRDGGWVQIAIDAPRDWWERFKESLDGSPEQHHMSAYTDVLTRKEINDLIRTLRRARDAAYGADE